MPSVAACPRSRTIRYRSASQLLRAELAELESRLMLRLCTAIAASTALVLAAMSALT